MAELILEYSTSITTADGQRFIPRTYGEERPDGEPRRDQFRTRRAVGESAERDAEERVEDDE